MNILILHVQEIMETRTVKLKKVMWPVKPAKDMRSNRPPVPIQNKMTKKSKIMPQEDDKNCLSTKYYGSMCVDKKCQATKCYKKVDKNCQTTNL